MAPYPDLIIYPWLGVEAKKMSVCSRCIQFEGKIYPFLLFLDIIVNWNQTEKIKKIGIRQKKKKKGHLSGYKTTRERVTSHGINHCLVES